MWANLNCDRKLSQILRCCYQRIPQVKSSSMVKEQITSEMLFHRSYFENTRKGSYKKYFARTRKGTMSKGVFEVWSRKMETLRDDALKEYGRAQSEEERQRIVDEVTQKLNKL